MRARPKPGTCLLIDGGTGSELRRRGVRLDPVAWSGPAALTHAQTLTEIHADYLDAGADVITTSTFGTARFVLEAAGFGAEFEAINRASVAAARRARELTGRNALLAGAISCLPPGFDVSAYPDPATERAAYAELATLLAELGVDVFALEMMEDTEHARRACEAVRAVGLPFWLGVSVRCAPGGKLVAYDFPETPFDRVLDALLEHEPAVVNVMHTPAEDVAPALAALAARWPGALGAYPEIATATSSETSTATPSATATRTATIEIAALAELAQVWLDFDVRVLGGCCGTGPEHVRALRALLDRHVCGSGFQP